MELELDGYLLEIFSGVYWLAMPMADIYGQDEKDSLVIEMKAMT